MNQWKWCAAIACSSFLFAACGEDPTVVAARKAAAEAETNKAAAEAEVKRLAAVAEAEKEIAERVDRRLAEEAEARKMARATEEKRLEDNAKKAVLEILNDPESARFGNFTRYASPKTGMQVACLTFHARNAYGGYGNSQTANLVMYKNSSSWISIGLTAHEYDCVLSLFPLADSYKEKRKGKVQ